MCEDGAAGGTERQAGRGPVSGACAANPRSRRVYGGYTLRSEIEAPLINRVVLPDTYFLLVIIAALSQAGQSVQFQASC